MRRIRTVLPALSAARAFLALEQCFAPLEAIAAEGLVPGTVASGSRGGMSAGFGLLMVRGGVLVKRDGQGVGGAACLRRGGDGDGLEGLGCLFGPCFDVDVACGRAVTLHAGVNGWVDRHGHVGEVG